MTVGAHIQSIAQIQDMPFDDVEVTAEQLDALRNAEYPVNNPRALEAMLAAIEEAREEQDSVGGVIECAAVGLPAGIGSPMLDSVESRLSSILFGVPAVKGVEFGAGFAFAALRGSHANDPFYEENGVVKTETNNNGGILGGITSGMPLIVRACIKPTPPSAWCRIRSISAPARSSRCPSTDGTTRASSPVPRRWSRPPAPLHWQIF